MATGKSLESEWRILTLKPRLYKTLDKWIGEYLGKFGIIYFHQALLGLVIIFVNMFYNINIIQTCYLGLHLLLS